MLHTMSKHSRNILNSFDDGLKIHLSTRWCSGCDAAKQAQIMMVLQHMLEKKNEIK